jgi:hypothetical protein
VPSAVEGGGAGLRRNQIAASPTTAYRERENKCEKWCAQFECSLCIIFASLLHTCLALYVEQVNERKLVCAWCIGKAALKEASDSRSTLVSSNPVHPN